MQQQQQQQPAIGLLWYSLFWLAAGVISPVAIM